MAEIVIQKVRWVSEPWSVGRCLCAGCRAQVYIVATHNQPSRLYDNVTLPTADESQKPRGRRHLCPDPPINTPLKGSQDRQETSPAFSPPHEGAYRRNG
jgi:hypothetical protein